MEPKVGTLVFSDSLPFLHGICHSYQRSCPPCFTWFVSALPRQPPPGNGEHRDLRATGSVTTKVHSSHLRSFLWRQKTFFVGQDSFEGVRKVTGRERNIDRVFGLWVQGLAEPVRPTRGFYPHPSMQQVRVQLGSKIRNHSTLPCVSVYSLVWLRAFNRWSCS